MLIDPSNAPLKEQQVLSSSEKERDFIKKLYDDMPQMLQVLSKGAPLSTLLNRFKNKLQDQLPQAYCLFVMCDKDCSQWRLEYNDSMNEELLNSNRQLTSVPQNLITFAATPSRSKQQNINIENIIGWEPWQSFVHAHSFTNLSMVSVSDGRGSIYLMLVFQKSTSLLEDDLMTLALDTYASWISAAFEREKADLLLLENSHRDSKTDLLRRYSFENSFGIVLKDSRRNFQRAALLSLRLLSNSKIDIAELKVLADVMRDAMRDNDLIAHYDERELVMGIRIQQLEDAEVVAIKLLESIQKPEYANNRLMSAGLSIGIAFYPEHSSLDSLYQAAFAAANSLKDVSGYRIEYHDAFYSSSSECYSL